MGGGAPSLNELTELGGRLPSLNELELAVFGGLEWNVSDLELVKVCG